MKGRFARLGFVLGMTLVILAGLLALFVGWLTTTSGNRFVKNRLVGAIQGSMDEGTFTIRDLRTDLFSTLEVDGVVLADGQGEPLLALDSVRARFEVGSLALGLFHAWDVEAVGGHLSLDSGSSGRMKLAQVFGPPSGSTDPFELPIGLKLDHVELRGVHLTWDDRVWLEGASLRTRFVGSGPTMALMDSHLCTQLVEPGPVALCAQGKAVWTGTELELTDVTVNGPGSLARLNGAVGSNLNLTAELKDVDLAALDGLAKHVGLQGRVTGSATVRGPGADLSIQADVRRLDVPDERAMVDLYVRASEELEWGGTVDALGLDVSGLYEGLSDSVVLEGRVGLQGVGTKYPKALALDLTYSGRAKAMAYDLEEVDVSGRIENGILVLERGAFDGVAGALDATGPIDLVDRVLDLRIAGELSSEQLAALGVEGLTGRGTVSARVNGAYGEASPRYLIQGRVAYDDVRYGDGVAFDTVVADISGWTRDGDLDLTVDATGTGGRVQTLGLGVVEGENLRVVSTKTGIQIDGEAQVAGLTIPDVGWFKTARTTVQIHQPTTGDATTTADVQLGSFDLQTFLGTGGRIGLVQTGDHVDLEARLWDRDREMLYFRGMGDLAKEEIRFDTLDVAPTPRLSWQAKNGGRVTRVEGGVDVDVDIQGRPGAFRVKGMLSEEVLDGMVRVDEFQLDALAELFPDRFSGLSGVLNLNTSVRGTRAEPQFEGRVNLQRLWVEDQTRWLDVEGGFDGDSGRSRVDLLLGSAGRDLVRVQGVVPAGLTGDGASFRPSEATNLIIDVLPGSLARFEDVTVADLGLPEGETSGRVEWTGSLRDPILDARGVLEVPLSGWRAPGRAEFAIGREDGELTTRVDLYEGLAPRGRLRGSGRSRLERVIDGLISEEDEPTDLRDVVDDLAVSAVLERMPIDSVARLAQLPVSTLGTVSGSITAAGSPYEPAFDGQLQWDEGAVGDVRIQRALFSVFPSGTGLGVSSRVQFDEGELEVGGEIPLAIDFRESSETWFDGPLDLELRTEALPLGLLAVVDGVEQARGRIRADGNIRGTIDQPMLDLEGGIDGGALVYTPLGLKLSELQADIQGRGRRLTLESLTAKTQPVYPVGLLDDGRASRIDVSGSASLGHGGIDAVDLDIDLDRAWLMGSFDVALRLDGGVRVEGPWPELGVNGDLDLITGRWVYRSEAVVSAPLQPVDELVIHRAGERRGFAQAVERPFYADFDVDLGVDLARNFEFVALTPFFDDLGQLTASLTKATVNARLGGNLDLGLNPDASPRLGGTVDVVDGTIQVLRSKFRFDEGRVVLQPDNITQSPVDVAATASIQGTPIDLRVTGTVGAPDLTTSSANYDQTQVLVMLLTGRSVEGLSNNQGQAATQLAVAMATLVTSSVFSDTASGALSIEADGSIRVGVPWSSTVFAELSLQPLADKTENQVAFQLEWALIRHLLLSTGAGNTYQWGDLSWETRF